MNEVITIENTEMQIREYNGQRVVTFDDICSVHKCERKRLTKHFERKRKHFLKDEDYYELTRKELNDLTSPNSKIIGNPMIKAYLFTESGYLMIIKCLDDDLAWKVQRQLVNSYFKVKQEISERKTYPLLVEDKWLAEMEPNFEYLCKEYKLTRKGLYHKILLDIGKSYNVDDYKILYKYEKGYESRFVMEVVSYFAELREEAEKTILEHVARKKNKKE
jgi:hypothetical protein